MARVLIAGEERGSRLLTHVASSLEQAGIETEVDFSGTRALSKIRENINLLVPLAVQCGAAALSHLPNLKAIIVPTIGFDWVDLDEATNRRIIVANTPVPENYESLAEATILLMLAASYQLHEAESHLREGSPPAQPRMLRGKTVGIVGFGRVARAVVERLRPFGVKIIVHTRTCPPVTELQFVSLNELLAQSDFVVLLASLNSESEHILDKNALSNIRRGSILINTARGGLIEEEVLPILIESGDLGYLALDVFKIEPLSAESPLRRLERTILTPHSLAHTIEARSSAVQTCTDIIGHFLKGEIPQSVLNPSAIGTDHFEN